MQIHVTFFLVLQVSIDDEIEIPEYNSTMGKEHPNVSREELYRQVWAEPISKLAETYNLSCSYIARMRYCQLLWMKRSAFLQVRLGFVVLR
jgi:hypothetical protein